MSLAPHELGESMVACWPLGLTPTFPQAKLHHGESTQNMAWRPRCSSHCICSFFSGLTAPFMEQSFEQPYLTVGASSVFPHQHAHHWIPHPPICLRTGLGAAWGKHVIGCAMKGVPHSRASGGRQLNFMKQRLHHAHPLVHDDQMKQIYPFQFPWGSAYPGPHD